MIYDANTFVLSMPSDFQKKTAFRVFSEQILKSLKIETLLPYIKTKTERNKQIKAICNYLWTGKQLKSLLYVDWTLDNFVPMDISYRKKIIKQFNTLKFESFIATNRVNHGSNIDKSYDSILDHYDQSQLDEHIRMCTPDDIDMCDPCDTRNHSMTIIGDMNDTIVSSMRKHKRNRKQVIRLSDAYFNEAFDSETQSDMDDIKTLENALQQDDTISVCKDEEDWTESDSDFADDDSDEWSDDEDPKYD